MAQSQRRYDQYTRPEALTNLITAARGSLISGGGPGGLGARGAPAILLTPGPRRVFFLASRPHLPYISSKNPADIRPDKSNCPNPRGRPRADRRRACLNR